MPYRDMDIRHATLVDLPLLYRMMDKAVLLESVAGCVRDRHDLMGVLRSSNVLLPIDNTHTLIARSDRQQLVGQFRLKSDHTSAQIMFIAPTTEEDTDDTLWLAILDAMVREAGRYEAHMLIAEVDELSPLFETMRTSGFSVYTRQQVWQRLPEPLPLPTTSTLVPLSEATDADMLAIHALLGRTLPSLMQSIPCTPEDAQRWIYKKNNRIEAYFVVAHGKHGIYIAPFINHQVILGDEAIQLFKTLFTRLPKSERHTVYVRVRRYQEWMGYVLEQLGFAPTNTTEAVMVRHITVRNKQHRLALGMQFALKVILDPVTHSGQPVPTPEDCLQNFG